MHDEFLEEEGPIYIVKRRFKIIKGYVNGVVFLF